MLKKSIIYLLSHLMLCIGIFLFIQKPIFLLYNWGCGGSSCTLTDWAAIYRHGLPLDVATAGYLTVIPFLIIGLYLFLPRFSPRKPLIGYNIAIAFLLSAVTLADVSLYEFWEFKLDATVFMYLNDPKNAFASVSFSYILLRVTAIIVLAAAYFFILAMPVYKIKFGHAGKSKRFPALICLAVFGGCLFCMIRGLRIWPNTPGRAFYSKTAFHNHSALNPLFNIAYTSLKAENFSKQFRFFTEEERAEIYDSILPRKGNAFPAYTTECLLKTTRPNILFIVLEGFGAVFIENLGGMKGIAPNIDRISEEAISFTRCYCNSFRTDRGIVSILSGYPAQPTTSIMRYSHKIQSLPGLPKTLKSYGYRTQALYASDMTFFNMADYFISAGHDKLISQDSFPASDRTCKWGVPDHIAFNWLYRDIQQKYGQGKEPWYTTFLTISSHAPFDVPYHRLADEKFNAFAYTDSCFGDFIDRLKNTPAWDNLLIVCTADHGFNHQEIASPDFPHIPLLLLGGAIKDTRRIDRLISQTDLAATVLAQLNIPYEEFTFSRDVMSDSYTYPFAFNTFNNGFIFRDSTGCTVYDNTAGKALYGEDKAREERGKAILQTLYNDLGKR